MIGRNRIKRRIDLCSSLVVIAVVITYLIASSISTINQLANAAARVESNSTSTICINNKPCVTTICINNQPCHTVTSNSTKADNSTDNKNIITSPFPQENI
jgi:hypothetical protein